MPARAVFLILLLGAVSATVETGPVRFSFQDAASLSGWKADPGTALSARDGYAELGADGPRARIWRTVTLPDGPFVLSGTGSPQLRITLGKTPDGPADWVCDTDYGSGDWRTNWHDVSGTGGTAVLAVEAPTGAGPIRVREIRFEAPDSAPTGPAPDPAVLARERPTPWPARGFMMGATGPQDFADARAMGANLVRLQVDPIHRAKQLGLPFDQAWPAYLEEVAGKVQAAGEAGLKVVVDFHGTRPLFDAKFESHEMWMNPAYEEHLCRVWRDLATRLKPLKAYVWGYDLYNEPVDRSELPKPPSRWYPIALHLLATIRAVDPDVWIVFEPGPGGMDRGFEGLVPLPDPHVIYSFHDYAPGGFTFQGVGYSGDLNQAEKEGKLGIHYPGAIKGEYWDQGRHAALLEPVDRFQAKWHVPIFVGEFSVVRWAPKDDAVHWLQDTIGLFESRDWSWTYHAFREWNGWSLEHDETFWKTGDPAPARATEETERARVVRQALEANVRAGRG